MEYYSPVKVLAGEGALDNIAVELASLDSYKPLIVTRSGGENDGAVRSVLRAFGETGVRVGVFAGIGESPSLSIIKDLQEVYLRRGFDSLIAVGGTQVTHTAKIANIALSISPSALRSMLASSSSAEPFGEKLRPLVFIPNLASDGYECSKYALFDGKRYASEFFVPNLLVIDKHAIGGVFAKDVAIGSAVAMAFALDSYYVCEKRSPFSDTCANSLLGLLLSSIAKTSMTGKWKVPLASALSLAGCLLSNTEGGLGYHLSASISRATGIAQRECLTALLPALLSYVLKRQSGDETDVLSWRGNILEMLMPVLDVDSPAAADDALVLACSKISAAAKCEHNFSAIGREQEQRQIASEVLGGTAITGCMEILGMLFKQGKQRRQTQ